MKNYEIWTHWTAANEGRYRPVHLGTFRAESFEDAVQQLIATHPPKDRRLFTYNPKTNKWSYWACQLHDNRDDAYEGWQVWWT